MSLRLYKLRSCYVTKANLSEVFLYLTEKSHKDTAGNLWQ
ncbi:hypothetical protein UYSO10_3341 [Kosakonia radicincitans]|nr:hypothetical protein UYSO10_3341 [Kosakonia radicincitans]